MSSRVLRVSSVPSSQSYCPILLNSSISFLLPPPHSHSHTHTPTPGGFPNPKAVRMFNEIMPRCIQFNISFLAWWQTEASVSFVLERCHLFLEKYTLLRFDLIPAQKNARRWKLFKLIHLRCPCRNRSENPGLLEENKEFIWKCKELPRALYGWTGIIYLLLFLRKHHYGQRTERNSERHVHRLYPPGSLCLFHPHTSAGNTSETACETKRNLWAKQEEEHLIESTILSVLITDSDHILPSL